MTIISQLEALILDNKELLIEVVGGNYNELSLSEIVKNSKANLEKIGRNLIQCLMAQREEEIFEENYRKKHFRVQRKADKRTISTLLGDIHYERRYYQDKVTGNYYYLLDESYGIEKSSRIDTKLEAEILSLSTQVSYQQTLKSFTNIGIHSKTTVMNIHRKHKNIEPELAPVEEKKEVKVLYIEADEDHVAFQDGTNQQMKLVYVHEGSEVVGKNRKELKNKRYYTGFYKGCNDELWDSVYQDIERRYDIDKIEKIYLSGDGASWIKQSLEVLPGKTLFVLDKFHTNKAIKKACVGVQNVYGEIKSWVNNNRKADVEAFFDTRLSDKTVSDSQRKQIQQMQTYLFNHWEEIQRQKETDYVQCSAEEHVSHVLSSRLSSRPLGWSEVNAESIAKIRAYELNGGSIKSHLIDKKAKRQKSKKIERVTQRVVKNSKKKDYARRGHLSALTHSRTANTRKYYRLLLS